MSAVVASGINMLLLTYADDDELEKTKVDVIFEDQL